jgi:hypothetical protein
MQYNTQDVLPIDGRGKKEAYSVRTLPTDKTVKFRKVQLKSELSVYIWITGVQLKCTEYALQAKTPAKTANMTAAAGGDTRN